MKLDPTDLVLLGIAALALFLFVPVAAVGARDAAHPRRRTSTPCEDTPGWADL
jgi:hypothetical protein